MRKEEMQGSLLISGNIRAALLLPCTVCWLIPPLSLAHLLGKLLLSNSNQCCISSLPFSWRLRHCSNVLFLNTFCFTAWTCLLFYIMKKTIRNQISIRIQEGRVREGQYSRVLWDLFDEKIILWQLIDFICSTLSFCHFRTDFCYLMGDESH